MILNKYSLNQHGVLEILNSLADCLKAGLPLIESLNILHLGENNTAREQFIVRLKQDLVDGVHLSASLAQNQDGLELSQLSIIKIGEQTGCLSEVLKQICEQADKQLLLRRRIKKALIYPTSILVVSAVVAWVLLEFALPQIAVMFINANLQLPLMTRIILTIADIVDHYAPLIALLSLGLVLAISYGAVKAPNSTIMCNLYRFLLYLPIIGKLVKLSFLITYIRSIATATGAAMPVAQALELAQTSIVNPALSPITANISSQVCTGVSLYAALARHSIFPPRLLQMIKVAERTNNLPKMLNQLTQMYTRELEHLIDIRLALAEYLIIIALGIFIGMFVIGIYLPMFSLGSTL